MGNNRLEMTKLETSCIYSQFSFVKKMRTGSPFLGVFFCECFVRVESCDIFKLHFESFWGSLLLWGLHFKGYLLILVLLIFVVYICFNFFFIYTCKWTYLDFCCTYPFNLLFMDLFYVLCSGSLCSFIYLFIIIFY